MTVVTRGKNPRNSRVTTVQACEQDSLDGKYFKSEESLRFTVSLVDFKAYELIHAPYNTQQDAGRSLAGPRTSQDKPHPMNRKKPEETVEGRVR